MARQPSKPEGIPKSITPTSGAATDPLDQGGGGPAAEPRPRAARVSNGAPSARDASRVPLPERQPSDAAPPDDDAPLESPGKAVSAPVRGAGRARSGGRGGAPR